MLKSINKETCFEKNIKKAINAIKSNKYDLACGYLHENMIGNDQSSEVYNLLGVISEYKRDVSLAGKYYRASYAFDPSYKPADNNLEKLTSFFYTFNEANIDFGDATEKVYKKSYFIEYNEANIGHLKNSETGIRSLC